MAAYFLDTSALVKRYTTETGTAWVMGLVDPASGHRVYVARITEVETVAALTRKQRGRHITTAEADAAITILQTELAILFRVVEITPMLFADAAKLARKHGLRGYDAVQLASAVDANNERVRAGLAPLVFVAADADLLAAAVAEGFITDNPNNH